MILIGEDASLEDDMHHVKYDDDDGGDYDDGVGGKKGPQCLSTADQ